MSSLKTFFVVVFCIIIFLNKKYDLQLVTNWDSFIIKKILFANSNNITDLTGLEMHTNLLGISMSINKIENLRPVGKLDKLRNMFDIKR
jgi:hypothetical protein